MVFASTKANMVSAGAKRRCFGLDASHRPETQHDVSADQQWLGVAEPETEISARGAQSSSNNRRSYCVHKQSPKVLHCRALLGSISDHCRRSLCGAFASSFNEHVSLLSEDQITDISRPQEEQDASVTLLNIAVLATGLLCSDKTEPEFMNVRISSDIRSALHSALKESIELRVLCGDSIDQLPILLMLSELECSVGYFGSADLYLREAIRIGAIPASHLDMSITDEEILRRRCYVRACDFIRLRRNLYEHQGSVIQSSHVERQISMIRRPNQALIDNDLRKSSYLAHHDLLYLVSNALQTSRTLTSSPDGTACEKLRDWYRSLPYALSWQSPRDTWPASLFCFHLQYLASQLLICADRADFKMTQSHQTGSSNLQEYPCKQCHDDAAKLADTLGEYDQSYTLSKAPLVVAYHAELAASVLLSSSIIASGDSGTSGIMDQLDIIQSALDQIASSHSAASSLAQRTRRSLQELKTCGSLGETANDDRLGELEYDSTIPGWQGLDTASFDDIDAADLFPMATLGDGVGQRTSAELQIGPEKDSMTTMCDQTSEEYLNANVSSPSQHLRNSSEERLLLFSDPVFCAYVDEMTYIVGQYNSPPVEGEHPQASNGDGPGSRTSSPKNAIQHLRMQLGYDPHDSGSDHPRSYFSRNPPAHAIDEPAYSRIVAPLLTTN